MSDKLSKLPYRHLGVIISRGERHVSYGTGILISRNLVLTCAHNIFNATKRILFKELSFYPGQHGLLTNPHRVESYMFPK